MITIGRLHVLTDPDPLAAEEHRDLARRAIAGGADVIQYRPRETSTRRMISIARMLVDVCRRRQIPLIVNDRVDVALAADAQGVHLGREDLPISWARRLLGPDRIIGASAAHRDDAIKVANEGADYIGLGPIYATRSKPDARPAIGAGPIGEVVRAVEIPVIAIGGITADRVPEVLGAGAHGVAVIEAVTRATDPQAAAAVLARAIEGGG